MSKSELESSSLQRSTSAIRRAATEISQHPTSAEEATQLYIAYERGKQHGYQQAVGQLRDERDNILWWGTFIAAAMMLVMGSFMNYVTLRAEIHAKALEGEMEAAVKAKENEIKAAKEKNIKLRKLLDQVFAKNLERQTESHDTAGSMFAVHKDLVRTVSLGKLRRHKLRHLGNSILTDSVRMTSVQEDIRRLAGGRRFLQVMCASGTIVLCTLASMKTRGMM